MNVRTLCLGILHFGDATGYEIRKMAQEGRFGHFIEASYGSIYPALLRLEEDGLVVSRKESHDGRPDRKVYSLNDAGRAELVTALYKDPRDDVIKSEFLFVMMCAELVSKDQVARLIDRRLESFDEKIAHLKDVRKTCDHTGSRFVVGFGLTMYSALRDYVAENRTMLEETAEQGGPPVGVAAE